jgi:hypothetical protein
LVYDEDYIYLASDDGIYRFNGAEEANIAQPVLDWWMTLLNKRNTVLELHNNRLYIFYTPNGESSNSRCKVYNVLYGIWESDDTKAYVSHTYASADQTGYFIQASNRVGMLMLAEQDTNDYNAMGEPLSFELRTNYNHYGTPAQLKYCPEYRPHFDSVSGTYGITVGYATDYSDAPSTSLISLAGTGSRFNTGKTFNSGVTFGGSAQINPMSSAPLIPGEWRRLQLRYSHTAAREPVAFDGHTISLQVQTVTVMPNLTPIPSGTDPAQVTAMINNNFRALNNEQVTKLYNDASGTPSILIGVDGTGKSVIKVAKTGMDVTTATDADLAFNSAQNTLKVVAKAVRPLHLYGIPGPSS